VAAAPALAAALTVAAARPEDAMHLYLATLVFLSLRLRPHTAPSPMQRTLAVGQSDDDDDEEGPSGGRCTLGERLRQVVVWLGWAARAMAALETLRTQLRTRVGAYHAAPLLRLCHELGHLDALAEVCATRTHTHTHTWSHWLGHVSTADTTLVSLGV
jgi:hypothetical protein